MLEYTDYEIITHCSLSLVASIVFKSEGVGFNALNKCRKPRHFVVWEVRQVWSMLLLAAERQASYCNTSSFRGFVLREIFPLPLVQVVGFASA